MTILTIIFGVVTVIFCWKKKNSKEKAVTKDINPTYEDSDQYDNDYIETKFTNQNEDYGLQNYGDGEEYTASETRERNQNYHP